MADEEQGAPTLAALLLKGHPARRSAVPTPGASAAPVAQGREQMSLLFSAPPAPGTKQRNAAVSSTGEGASGQGRRTPAAEQPRSVWKVRALVADVRESLEASYEEVWVEGEISNCRPAPSGHLYLTLKDGDAQLSLVLFRRQAQLLRFTPKDGMEVLARGRISLFEQRGQLQLIAESLEARGAGSLQLAFEQLKARLRAEGLFDAERKRPLPPFARCIGVITSTRGAVIHDIIRVVERRHAALELLIFPAAMQGPECSATVAAGIRYFNQSGRATPPVDLILIARGGGSLEDLAGFNDESLARAIAASALPVVSAIGHETDLTIADFAADLRAPTPSAAAEIITAAQHRIEERVAGLADRVHRAMRYRTMMARQRFTQLSAAQVLARVRDGIDRQAQHVDDLRRRLDNAIGRRLTVSSDKLAAQARRVARHDPRLVLLAARHRLESARRALTTAAQARLAPAAARLQHAQGRLAALSPVAVLDRGYALVYSAEGRLLRSAAETAPGQTIRARLGRGSLAAEVVTLNEES
ncbi:MAG: exodeoxyribonuclease VII large subunit [Acidobacteriota bacterium]|nr:exodeoxyribonuclease VII large subunit [Acidobacteriota bacterium]